MSTKYDHPFGRLTMIIACTFQRSVFLHTTRCTVNLIAGTSAFGLITGTNVSSLTAGTSACSLTNGTRAFGLTAGTSFSGLITGTRAFRPHGRLNIPRQVSLLYGP
jgi:hypothetical protein